MDTRLDSLDARFRPLAMELLARLVEARLPVVIVNTRRTPEEQIAAVASGHSWVTHSKHEDGLAIDLCPFDTYQLHGANKLAWDADLSTWQHMAEIAEGLGLRCGFRWKQRDLGHYELA